MQTEFPTLFFVIALAVAFRCCTSSKRYVVGNAVWSIPSYPNFYDDWSSSLLFTVGDSLLFDFELGFHNVIQVPRLDYQTCTANNPIKVLEAEPAIVLLAEPGVFYFVCNISNYCHLGQKVCIIVQEQSTNLSPTPSPSSVPSAPSLAPPLPRFQSPPETSPAPLSHGNSSEAPAPAGLGITVNCAVGSTGMLLRYIAFSSFIWVMVL